MTKKELLQKRKEMRAFYQELRGLFDTRGWEGYGKLISRKPDFPKELPAFTGQSRDTLFHPKKYSIAKRFKMQEEMKDIARAELHPLWRWINMTFLIGFNMRNFSYHQKQWSKAFTKRQMNIHNRTSGRLLNIIDENLQLLMEDQQAWEIILPDVK